MSTRNCSTYITLFTHVCRPKTLSMSSVKLLKRRSSRKPKSKVKTSLGIKTSTKRQMTKVCVSACISLGHHSLSWAIRGSRGVSGPQSTVAPSISKLLVKSQTMKSFNRSRMSVVATTQTSLMTCRPSLIATLQVAWSVVSTWLTAWLMSNIVILCHPNYVRVPQPPICSFAVIRCTWTCPSRWWVSQTSTRCLRKWCSGPDLFWRSRHTRGGLQRSSGIWLSGSLISILTPTTNNSWSRFCQLKLLTHSPKWTNFSQPAAS